MSRFFARRSARLVGDRTDHSLEEVGHEGLVLRRKCFAGQLVERSLVAGAEIEPQFVGEIEQVAPRIAVAARKLIDELFDADGGLGQNPLLIADRQGDLFAERRLQQGLEIRRDRGWPVPRSGRIAALAFLELMFPRWKAGANSI